MDRIQSACVTCGRRVRAVATQSSLARYREFLLDPGTLITFASLLLLIAAGIEHPGGLLGSGDPAQASSGLYLIAALTGSLYIWWSALQGIRARDFTADIPVSIATIAAIAIGQYSAAAVVAVLLLLGGLLEEFVAARAGKALEALAQLLPARVTVRRNGRDTIVPLDTVVVDDLLLVRPGERIAVDGVIVSGTALVNQAPITGESMPVEKAPGASVYAGTLLQSSALEIRATKVGEETTLGQIRRMVEEAQEQKAPIERLLDGWAKVYTPVALVLAGLLWWLTGDPVRGITMLIVFCPCVMVLATPTALVASIGNAALRGSLVKRGATIESLAKVDTIAFDKTGTLTFGQPRLVEAKPLGGLARAELLQLAAAAEKFSEHPLARAVVQAAEDGGRLVADPDSFEALPGLGVRASVAGRQLLLGQTRLLAERGVPVGREAEEQVATLTAPGRTVILVAVDGQLAGLLVLEDALRPAARGTVARLHQLGLRTVLVSGDNRATAERVGAELGIREVHAEVLPREKVEIVQQLQDEGRVVAFVGDGVNDGPALATAHVGVAMGLGGTDVAIETAEIALLSDDLTKLPHLFDLSQRALRAIRQNLAFSLAVLALAVGLTIPGILTPITGALLHELSSIPVIMNSARLIGAKERKDRPQPPMRTDTVPATA